MISLVCLLSGSKTPLQSFLGIAEQHTAHNGVRISTEHFHTQSTPPLTSSITSNHLSLSLSEQCVPVCQSPQPYSHHSRWVLQPRVQPERPRHWTSCWAHKQSPEVKHWKHPVWIWIGAPERYILPVSSPGLKRLCGWVSLILCPWPSRLRPSLTSWPSPTPTLPSYVTS